MYNIQVLADKIIVLNKCFLDAEWSNIATGCFQGNTKQANIGWLNKNTNESGQLVYSEHERKGKDD